MTTAFFRSAWVDGQNVSKDDIRDGLRDHVPYVVDDAAELNALDTEGIRAVLVAGQWYDFDPADTTSADNGDTVLVSADGDRYKRTSPSAAETAAAVAALVDAEAAADAAAASAAAAAASAAAAEAAALAVAETGTFTPALGATRVGSYSAASGLTTTYARYTKMGKMVFCRMAFTFNGLTAADMTLGSAVSLTGLPFPVANLSGTIDMAGVSGAIYKGVATAQNTVLAGYVSSSTSLFLFAFPTATNNAQNTDVHFVSVVYEAA